MAEHAVVLQQQIAAVVVEVLRTQVVQVQTEPLAVHTTEGDALVLQQGGAALTAGMQPGTLVVQPVTRTEVVTVGIQGPPGRDADAVTGALREVNRLSEYASDPDAQADVQQNIGLAFDPLAYYILARA